MNKTININLGGFFFHIDEIAYQKLRRYLESISKSLSDDPQGKNEIISDIEARISELLSERITDARQVVNESDIEEVIVIMGQPEDYAEVEEDYASSGSSYQRRNNTSKKLFRDSDDKFLGGVCAGLAHYVGIDVIWMRLLTLVLMFGAGFGFIVYFILWILLPEAKTTTEKLQMEGEPVNIDNIEKKIRDEFDSLSTKVKDGANELTDKITSADYAKLKQQSKSGFQDFLDTLGKILLAFFKVIGKFIGILLMFIAGAVLISLLIGGFSMGSFEVLNLSDEFVQYPPFFYESQLPKWLLSIFGFLALGIPFLILFVLGLRILSSNVKRFSKTTSLVLLGIWLISLFGLAFSGIEYATSRAYDGTKIIKSDLNFVANDTINIKVVNDDDLHYLHNLRRSNNTEIVTYNGEDKTYSNWVKIDVRESNSNKTYVEIRKKSEGKSRKTASISAEEIEYNFNQNNNDLTLNAYFLSNPNNLHRNEGVTATVFIPKGTTVFFETSSRRFLYDIKNVLDIYDTDMVNHYFTMTDRGLECNDCEDELPLKKERKEQKEDKKFKLKADENGVEVEF